MSSQYKTQVSFNLSQLQLSNLGINEQYLNNHSKNILLSINKNTPPVNVNFTWRKCFQGNDSIYMVTHDYKGKYSAKRCNVLNAIKLMLESLKIDSLQGNVVLFAYQGNNTYL